MPDDGEYLPVDVPDRRSTNALDINDRGQIVGFYERGASGGPLQASAVSGGRPAPSSPLQMWGVGS